MVRLPLKLVLLIEKLKVLNVSNCGPADLHDTMQPGHALKWKQFKIANKLIH